MLFRSKSLRHDVCEVLEGVDFSEFDDTGSVKMSRIVKWHVDMLGLVACYRGTNGAQCAVRVAVNNWNCSFTGDVSM